jgi:hypothetical protein
VVTGAASGIGTAIADLSQLKLDSFEIFGGASKVELTLPRVSGLVPVRVLGALATSSFTAPGALLRGSLSSAVPPT